MAANHKIDKSIKPANTFIGKDITLRVKKLSGQDSVRVDGRLVGDVELDGYLHVGKTGYVEGNLHCSYALIAGQVQGNILCRATTQLAAGAVVTGNITTERIIVDDGAILQGVCKTREHIPQVEVV